MAELSPDQIAGYAKRAGFRGEGLVDSIAIAEAESSGETDATSANPDGGTNVGLWQEDTPGGAGAGHTVAELEDPQTNADVAYRASRGGTNWGPWSTWPSPASNYLAEARKAAGNPAATSGGKGVLGDLDSIPVLGGLLDVLGFKPARSGGDLTGLNALTSSVAAIGTEFEGASKVLTWITLPSNWTRIFAGILGAALLGAGIYLVGKEARA